MKILLLNPPYFFKVVREGRCQHEAAIWDSVYPPLSLATLAAHLRDEHEVRIIDAVGEERELSDVLSRIKDFDPELVIASVSTPTIGEDLRVLSEVKQNSRAKTAVFGVHATHFADEIIREDAVDYVLLNDPEQPAASIAGTDRSKRVGVVTLEGDRIIRTPVPSPQISSFKPPAWDLVDLTKYRIPIKGKSYVLVFTARGCPFGCNFCVVPSYYGKKIRFRPVDEMMEELRVVSQQVDEVFFHTDLFTFRKDYVLELCNRMVQEGLNLNWICNSRVDTFDREMAEAMKKAGCWMISFGIESGNQKVLDLCHKKITLEQSREAVRITREVGIISIGHFVLGFPGETRETLQQTLKFSREVDPDIAEFYIATPFPGSPLFETIKDDLDLDWKDIRYDVDPYQRGFDLGKIRRSAYLRFYLRPKKIFRFIHLFGVGKILNMALSAVRFLFALLKKKA